jgi:pimeloyl-ACP methyl ester carboxylesterase
MLAWLCLLALICVLAGSLYQALGRYRDNKRFPPPGRLIDIGTRHVHLLEEGTSGPTIVLEAGLMSTVLSWSDLQHELARSYLVVSYDRPGLGWSDLGPMPRTADRIVLELHDLLHRAGVPPPYLLVGHSFGGLTMPLFASRFPQETTGLVLIDPVTPSEWHSPSDHDRRLTRIGATICRRAALLSRIGVIRFVAFLLSTPLKGFAARLVRLISRGAPGDSGTVSSAWFTALPAKEQEMAGVFWLQEKFALTIASQLENLPVSAAQLSETANRIHKPVVILSSSTSSEKRRQGHEALAASLRGASLVLAEKSNHWIMQAQPELVLAAVDKIATAQQQPQEVSPAAVTGE